MTLTTFFLGSMAVWGWALAVINMNRLSTARNELDAVRSTSRMIAKWWMDAQDKLDESHEKHVRAGRTPHQRRREKVKDVAALLAISPPCQLRSRVVIEGEAKAALQKRRERVNASLK